MTREEKMLDSIKSSVRAISYNAARSREQREDFEQEGFIGALEAVRRYGNKPNDELTKIAIRCAANRIIDCQRREIKYSDLTTPISPHNAYITSQQTPNPGAETERNDLWSVLMVKLNARQRKIVEIKLKYGPDARVAKYDKMSDATASRAWHEIIEKAQEIPV